ncbi:MAG: hypothetical protein ACRDGL_10885 [Candidatus Limnocylindrales bacterium]
MRHEQLLSALLIGFVVILALSVVVIVGIEALAPASPIQPG